MHARIGFTLILLTVVIVAVGAQAPVAPAPVYRWIGGLDVFADVYATRDEKGAPGPRVNTIGYDRDAGVVSVLRVADQCHLTWGEPVVPGHGGVKHILQLDVRRFVLYLEDGFLQVIDQPDFVWCVPVTG